MTKNTQVKVNGKQQNKSLWNQNTYDIARRRFFKLQD